jgi:hypothetical protein
MPSCRQTAVFDIFDAAERASAGLKIFTLQALDFKSVSITS